jgi:hypothetical protein
MAFRLVIVRSYSRGGKRVSRHIRGTTELPRGLGGKHPPVKRKKSRGQSGVPISQLKKGTPVFLGRAGYTATGRTSKVPKGETYGNPKGDMIDVHLEDRSKEGVVMGRTSTRVSKNSRMRPVPSPVKAAPVKRTKPRYRTERRHGFDVPVRHRKHTDKAGSRSRKRRKAR